jgi:hypothetical protein
VPNKPQQFTKYTFKWKIRFMMLSYNCSYGKNLFLRSLLSETSDGEWEGHPGLGPWQPPYAQPVQGELPLYPRGSRKGQLPRNWLTTAPLPSVPQFFSPHSPQDSPQAAPVAKPGRLELGPSPCRPRLRSLPGIPWGLCLLLPLQSCCLSPQPTVCIRGSAHHHVCTWLFK